MNSQELRSKFLEYFKGKGHKVIPSASLVPENDPTALFVSAGMQPLVPYLMGEQHPAGKRLVDCQKCIRTDDIDEVGDKVHHTFFEMLGNWSLGDYFKKEAIEYSFEFLTNKKWLGLDKERLAVSVFAGDDDAPFDKESYDKWIELGMPANRIAKLPKKNNWWGPVGDTGPCGPDTEMFYWTGKGKAPDSFQETCDHPSWVEVWNDVFMEYGKQTDGKYEPLKQKNVDTGMGLERMLAVKNGIDDNYKTDLFKPIIKEIEELSGFKYGDKTDEEHIRDEGQCWIDARKQFRIIADHIRAAVFAISDGILPSNKGAGYVVRRLIRRTIVKANQLGIKDNFAAKLAKEVFYIYKDVYFSAVIPTTPSVIPTEVEESFDRKDLSTTLEMTIVKELEKEEEKFFELLKKSDEILNKVRDKIESFKKTAADLSGETKEFKWETGGKQYSLDRMGALAFDLYQTNGIPPEISYGSFVKFVPVSEEEFYKYFIEAKEAHQDLSRTASAGMFKGGLADAGEIAVKYHTATHLLHQALRQVLGDHVQQKGSNITAERLRFDFVHTDKITPEQIAEVEQIVNEQIEKDLPVTMEEMTVEEAKNSGALGFFEHKYGDKVKVYTIGESTDKYFSKEICGGPHVSHTGELGHFKIKKEESSSAGIRRIKAVLS